MGADENVIVRTAKSLLTGLFRNILERFVDSDVDNAATVS
jgi:hypothetical protein